MAHLCDSFDAIYKDATADILKQQSQLKKLHEMYTSCRAELLDAKLKLSECQATLADTSSREQLLAAKVSKLESDRAGDLSMLQQSRDVLVDVQTSCTSAEQQLCKEKLKSSSLEASIASLKTQLASALSINAEDKQLIKQLRLRNQELARHKFEFSMAAALEQANNESLIKDLRQQLADSDAHRQQLAVNLVECQAENHYPKQLDFDGLISLHDHSFAELPSLRPRASSSSPVPPNSKDSSPVSSIGLKSKQELSSPCRRAAHSPDSLQHNESHTMHNGLDTSNNPEAVRATQEPLNS